MNKRETALEIIRIEYAIHRCGTVKAMRAYVENPVSYASYMKAREAGKKQYIASKKKGGR